MWFTMRLHKDWTVTHSQRHIRAMEPGEVPAEEEFKKRETAVLVLLTYHGMPLPLLHAGTRVNTFLWARTSGADNQVNIQYMLLDANSAPTGTKADTYSDVFSVVSSVYEQFPLVSFCRLE